MMHRLQRYGTVNSKRHPRNLILGCLFVSSSFHSVPSSALCFAKSLEVDNLPFPEELDGIVDIGIVGKA